MDKQSTFQGYQPISFVRDRDIGSQMTTSDGSIYKYIPSYSASPGTDSGYHSPSRSMDFTHTHLQPLAFAHLHPTNNAAIMNDPHIMPRSSPDNLHLVRGALQLMNDEVDDLDIEYYHTQLERITMGVEIPYIRRRTSFRRVAAALKDTDYARKRQSSSMYDRSGNCKTSVGFGSLIDESVGDDMAGCCEYTSNTYSAGSRLASETAWGLHPGDSSADSKGKKEIMQLRNWREPSQPTIVQTQQVAPPDHVPVERVIEELIANVPAHVQQIAAEVQKKQAEVEQRLGFGTLQPFRPSHSVLQRLGLISNLDVLRATATTTQCGGSDKYFGDIAIAHSRSTNIPENQNCSLWILGLPANVTHAQLLGAIREIGKVYATVINPPTLTHHTSAAKLVFFERSQAERLMYRIQTGSFKVMGQSVVDVRWNTFKSAAYPQPDHSRSIRITGPAHLMDFDFFEIFFKSRFTYELDRRAAVRCSSPGMVAHEWHFGSLRCQAASAKTAIERELQTIFLVQWARDPCAFP